MTSDYVIALTTLPADADAAEFARTLVDERLAACVNLMPVMESVYRWEGKIEFEAERQIVIKTSRDRVSDLWDRVRELHPYEVPEFVVIPIVDGNEAYLAVDRRFDLARAALPSAAQRGASACASRSSIRSAGSSIPAEIAHQAVGQPDGRAPLRRHRRVRHGGRMADERFDATQAFGQRHEPDTVADVARRLEASPRRTSACPPKPRICRLASSCCG